jgi:hypothetical protein
LNLRSAFFVLSLFALVPFRSALAEPQAGSDASEAPTSSVPAPSPPAPPPPAPPPSTPGYTEPSTPVYAPLLPPSADAPAPQPDRDPSALRDRRYADAHVDRVVFFPTAETHPEGTFYVSSYEVVVLQAGYAVSDRTQVTVTAMPPLEREAILPFDLTLKTVLARTPEVRVAALGSVSGISGTDLGTGVVGRVGGVVQLCFEWACRSSVSLSTNVALVGPAIFVGNSAGIILRASPHVSALLELEAAIPIGTTGNQFNGIAVAPGIRFSGEHFALDLAFAHALDVLEGPALPFIAATYRTGSK